MYILVALNIVLVHPCAGENVGVADGRYGRSLRIHADFAAAIGTVIVARAGDVHDCGRLEALDAVGWNAVDNYEKCLARLADSRQC